MDSNKTSVKVHHAPGGASSFSLGWGNDEPPAPTKAKPVVAGDVGGGFGAPSGAMRSENNIGADGGERTSVKVHHAPGGQSSFTIFDGSSGSAGDVYAPPASEKKTQQQEELQQQMRLQALQAKQNIALEPAAAHGPGKFGGAPAAGQGTGVPTSVKVHNPPGGKSQISFG